MTRNNQSHFTTPFVLAIDIGTSSVRAVVFDAKARQIHATEHRERYRLTVTPNGGSMCNACRIRRLVVKCVAKSVEKAGAHGSEIAAVGVSCHWHSLLGLDANGVPITPVYMWNDRRAAADSRQLRSRLDRHTIHQRTGCRLHSSYWPAKLVWLRRTEPELWSNVHRWCSLADWLMAEDGDGVDISTSMASATGLFNTTELRWDEPLLQELEIGPAMLPSVSSQHTPRTSIHPDLRQILPDVRWFQPIGDGAAANIGAGAIGADQLALTIGTSGALRIVIPSDSSTLPPGLFRYLADDDHAVIGGALSNGGNQLRWLTEFGGITDRTVLANSAANIAPDSHGLTFLPFFAGERAPGWHDTLGGTITGITLATTQAEIYRSILETTAYRLAGLYEDMRPYLSTTHAIIANGGSLLQSPLWAQIIADVLGQDIVAMSSRAEASARGAAVWTLFKLGILPSLHTDIKIGHRYRPNVDHFDTYQKARERHSALEQAVLDWESSYDNAT